MTPEPEPVTVAVTQRNTKIEERRSPPAQSDCELRIADCKLQIADSPAHPSEAGAYGGRAFSDDFGKAVSAMRALRCAPVLRRASREVAAMPNRDSPQRDESDGRLWRIGMPGTSERRALGGARQGDTRVEVRASKRTRGPAAATPDDCRCSLFPAAAPERCRCILGIGKDTGTQTPHVTLSRVNQTFNVQPSWLRSPRQILRARARTTMRRRSPQGSRQKLVLTTPLVK